MPKKEVIGISYSESVVDASKSSGKISLTLIILVVGFFCFTNPSKTEFVQYASEHISSKISEKLDTNSSFINNLVSGLTSLLVDGLIQHQNYLLFSTYTLDLNLVRQFGGNVNDVKFLGIAGQFIPLKMPDLNAVSTPTSTSTSLSEPSESMQYSIPNVDCAKNTVCEKEEIIEIDVEKKTQQ